jgi:hypothetical protein
MRAKWVIPASGFMAISVAMSLFVTPVADAAPKKLKLLWSEEFNGKKGVRPSSKIWATEIGGGGWGNSERQYYTDKAANASLDGAGRLVITANRISNEYAEQIGTVPGTEDILNRCSECQFTSARLKTARKVGFMYGRMEARMKMPQGIGTWPAFWMLGGDLLDGVPWPECGEIDIMEFRGDIPERSTSAILRGLSALIAAAPPPMHSISRRRRPKQEPELPGRCLCQPRQRLQSRALSQLEANVPPPGLPQRGWQGVDVHHFKSDDREQQQEFVLSLICPASKSSRTWEGFVWYRSIVW